MGFKGSRAENDIWMRRIGNHYKYIVRYVDNLGIVAKDPEEIINKLTTVDKLKLKGTGPIGFHLGSDFFCDKNGVICMTSKSYVEC